MTVHIVFVTKYRRKVIDAQMLVELKSVFESVLKAWNCQLIETKKYFGLLLILLLVVEVSLLIHLKSTFKTKILHPVILARDS